MQFDWESMEYNAHCVYCYDGIDHSINQHEKSIAKAYAQQNKRDAALLRQAKREYDRP